MTITGSRKPSTAYFVNGKSIEIQMDYMSADEYWDAALGWFDNKRLDKAIDTSSEGISKYPNFPGLYRLRSTFYEACEEYDKAIKDAAKFIELQPNEVSMIGYLGHLLHMGGRLQEAEKQLTIAIEKSPNLLSSYLDRSEVRLKLGQISSATRDLRHYYESHGRDNVDELIQKHVSGSKDTR